MKSIGNLGLHLMVAATLSLFAASASASAATVVNVKEAEGPTDYSITLDRTSVPAGEVKFKVTNQSKSLEHEFVVVKTALAPNKLPYNEAAQRVEEDKVNVVGEVEGLEPGDSGSNTFALKPGKYVAICNEPGHYNEGMYAPFTVTK